MSEVLDKVSEALRQYVENYLRNVENVTRKESLDAIFAPLNLCINIAKDIVYSSGESGEKAVDMFLSHVKACLIETASVITRISLHLGSLTPKQLMSEQATPATQVTSTKSQYLKQIIDWLTLTR